MVNIFLHLTNWLDVKDTCKYYETIIDKKVVEKICQWLNVWEGNNVLSLMMIYSISIWEDDQRLDTL